MASFKDVPRWQWHDCTTEVARLEDCASYVYFLRAHGGNNDGLIKIGKSNDVRSRIKAIRSQYKCEIEFLGAIKAEWFGASYLEKTVHAMFRAELYIPKEWFVPTERLIAWVYRNADHVMPAKHKLFSVGYMTRMWDAYRRLFPFDYEDMKSDDLPDHDRESGIGG